jgi:hypothetical protein
MLDCWKTERTSIDICIAASRGFLALILKLPNKIVLIQVLHHFTFSLKLRFLLSRFSRSPQTSSRALKAPRRQSKQLLNVNDDVVEKLSADEASSISLSQVAGFQTAFC